MESCNNGWIYSMTSRLRYSLALYGLSFTLTVSMIFLTVFAFEQSSQTAFAQNQSSPLSGMNFSKPIDVYSKDGVLNATLVAEYKIGTVDNQPITAMVYNGSLPGPTFHV